MARSLRYLFVLLFLGISAVAYGQATGEIAGKVIDPKNEPIITASVEAFEGGILKGQAVTDYDGNYSIKPLEPGHYSVTVKYTGMKDATTTDVLVSPDKTTGVNFAMESSSSTTLVEHVFKVYKKPLIDKYDAGSNTTVTSAEIEKMTTRNITEVAANSSVNVYQQRKGGDLSIGGARSEGTLYIIDGVQVQGTQGISLAQNSVDQVEVLTSGIPAKYGDATGGIINITSKGVSQNLAADVLVQHSIDGYNNNLVNFSLSGPIYKKKLKDGTRKPLMGFALSGEYNDDHNRDPQYYEPLTTKADVLSNLRQNPLTLATDASGLPFYKYSSEYITRDQMVAVKQPADNRTLEGKVNGKLDFQVADNLNITVGGSYDQQKNDVFSRGAYLFTPESIPTDNTITARGYFRFTQRFGKNGAPSGDTKPGIISNAYYSVQADYQKQYTTRQDPNFKKNIFDYQYVGKFNRSTFEGYQQLAIDSVTGIVATGYQGSLGNGLSYDRSNLTPTLANYTSEYYALQQQNNIPTESIAQIQATNGITNGDLPRYANDLFPNVGSSFYGYSVSNFDQYALNVDASFDLLLGKTRHAIEFGLYYQQRIERSYLAYSNNSAQGTTSLWQLMRQLVSSKENGNLKLDKTNPIFIVNGHQYTKDQVQGGSNQLVTVGVNDTVLYNYKNQDPTTFDNNLRKKLGLNSTQDINIDALDPSTFSLSMFSADELLNTGNSFVSYEGYTYTGGRQTGNVNFNDFFTKKDANGDYTRPIAPFSPNYIAGYIMDKFSFKDIAFNIGVRIERYSANTKVLTDPYSLYPVLHVKDVPGSQNRNNEGTHPSNIGSNYVVYVDDNSSSNPSIIGYRNGDSWYDPFGRYVEDPKVLKQYSQNQGDPVPYLPQNSPRITDSAFNPNQSFTDYTPQVRILPRIQFSFPISEVAQLYAHYDILSQRPTGNIDANALTYVNLSTHPTNIINNPDLKPQTTYDYEVGFKQALSKTSSINISGFYKERKDMITVRPYLYAWPSTYYTYGNRDFSTTKGMSVKYDLRRISHMRITLAYTLQFAEGTGSNANSTNSGGGSQPSANGLLNQFISAGLPNLRYVSTLDNDSRHNIKANIDYRFGEGEGPVAGSTHFLQNAGIDLQLNARSGEPYTKVTEAQGNIVEGGVNGSRLPWHYGMDIRIDKDFAVNFHKKAPADASAGSIRVKRPFVFNAFVIISNVLNTRDVLGVYGYTGRPDDNGYITSPYGIQKLQSVTSAQAYTDQYNYAYNDPNHYNQPRTVNMGIQFNF